MQYKGPQYTEQGWADDSWFCVNNTGSETKYLEQKQFLETKAFDELSRHAPAAGPAMSGMFSENSSSEVDKADEAGPRGQRAICRAGGRG